MSLGLNDLKKKRRASNTTAGTKKSVNQTQSAERFPGGAWAKSETATPWDSNGLQKAASRNNRRRTYATDSVMSDEWVDNHSDAVLTMQTGSTESIFNKLQNILHATESKIKRASERPLWLMQNFLPVRFFDQK